MIQKPKKTHDHSPATASSESQDPVPRVSAPPTTVAAEDSHRVQ
jgi:hypothetical protein